MEKSIQQNNYKMYLFFIVSQQLQSEFCRLDKITNLYIHLGDLFE